MEYGNISDCTILHNGVRMPWLGFGVYKLEDGKEAENGILSALNVGYRSVDTASFYGNEQSVGNAVRRSCVPREEIFVTTKVWNADQRYDSTLRAFDQSMSNLGLDYLDLYLIHWPVKGMYKDTWRALEKIYRDQRVFAIGVSNFQVHHLTDIMNECEIKPMVNQVEYHPRLSQMKLRAFCSENDIRLEAWSPLMRGELLEDPTLKNLAKKYGKTAAQIILRWDIQSEVITIPKSSHINRIRENADIFDFYISDEDMALIDGLNIDQRSGPDPDNFDF